MFTNKSSVLKLFMILLMLNWGLLLAQEILTPEMIVDMKYVTSVAMQPQGNYVAYTLRVQRGEDEKPGGSYSELWVVAVKGGEPRQYVGKPNSVRQVAWTPDGKEITFLSKREEMNEHTQVYAIPLDGGEARPISHAPRDINRYALSPDGKLLAYSMRDEEPDSLKKLQKQGFDQKVADTWTTINRIYTEDLSTGEVKLLTEENLHVWEFDWSPDGKNIVFRASERPFTDDSYMFTRNYIIPVEGGKARLLYPTEGKLELAALSPDGKYAAWLGGVDLHDPYAGSLFLLQMGSEKAKNLLEGFEGTAVYYKWLNEKSLALITIENTSTVLYRVEIPSGKMKEIPVPESLVFTNLSFSKDGKWLAASANRFDHPNELYVGKWGDKTWNRLTVSNPEFNNMKFGEQSTISWKAKDGMVIYGVLVKPVGYEPGKKYPLQLQIHGGPESAILDGWNTYYSRWVQMLAQRGYMVLMPNYRGSIGRGVAFAKADQGDMMGAEFEDILAGVDYLVEQGMVDPDRVGIGGGSYGGYTSAWAATRHSERFKASIVFAGISNQISKLGTTDIPMESQLVHWNLKAHENLDKLWDRSPLKYITNARTPTLIAHGERDERVHVGQAYELYLGLKSMNVPTQLVIYPREPHGLRERAHQLDFCKRALEWYEKYLKGAN